jgi:hypothetical protein
LDYPGVVRALWLCVAAACSFTHGATNNGGGGGGGSDAPAVPDAPPDVAIDARIPDGAPGSYCVGTGLNICLPTTPTGDITLPMANPLDTGMNNNCTNIVMQTNGPELCVVAGTNITVTADMTATGMRPLVLIATNQITLNFTIDVSSTSAGATGAGFNSSLCIAAGPGANDNSGASGGAGGGFGTAGADGGDGDGNNAKGGKGGKVTAPTPVHGGCPGGKGGDGDAGHHGGAGGNGGGALVLIAGTSINSGASLYASGAGGVKGTGNNVGADSPCGGGGGGGSGGLIALDAPMVTIGGVLAANGAGGGGGGGDNGTGTSGGDGTISTLFAMAATGGNGGGSMIFVGGAGGNGAGGTNAPTAGGSVLAGGGGGGGAEGVVWVHSANLQAANVSPAATMH